jgi:hypothetical protein
MEKTMKLNPINHGLSVLAMAAAAFVAVTAALAELRSLNIASRDDSSWPIAALLSTLK